MADPHRFCSVLVLALAGACGSLPTGATDSTPPAPPPTAPRLMAEWEPALGTLVVYPFELPDALVADLGHEAELFVLVQAAAREEATAKLAALGLAGGDYQLVPTEVDTPWTRDWGPHQVATADGQRVLVDHIFHGYPWVPADCDTSDIEYSFGRWEDEDAAIGVLAEALGLPTTELPAVATGGNLLTDGHGRAFCTEAQLVENLALASPGPIDEPAYRALLAEHLGIQNLVVLENTEPFGIQHIDCWLKVVDPETLLVKQAPEGHPEHAPIERNVELLHGLKTPSGGHYRILRIDCPPYRRDQLPAYTNSLRVNDVVHVPLFGGEADERALATYRAAFPGCEVRGYAFPDWKHFDALHCRARALYAAP